MYQALSFAPGQIFTASAANQIVENIAQTRQFDWGSTVSSPGPGQFRWNTSSGSYWKLELFQGSLWLPALFYDPAQNEIGPAPNSGSEWGAVPMVTRDRGRTEYSGPAWTPRNMLLNGHFQYWQRGNSFQVGSGRTYTADRWMVLAVGSMKLNVRPTSLTPDEGTTRQALEVQVAVPAATASGSIVQVLQAVEGSTLARTRWGTGYARPCYIGAWLWSNVTGRVTFHIVNASRNAVFCAPVDITVANQWQFVSAPIPATNSVGYFTDDIGVGAWVGITLSADTSWRCSTPSKWLGPGAPDVRAASGQLIAAATSGTLFRISEVQFELGALPTPFEVLPPALELPMIRRYFTKTFDMAQAPRDSSGVWEGALGVIADQWGFGLVPWQVAMRATPTLTFYNPRSGGAAGRWGNYDIAGSDGRFGAAIQAGELGIIVTMSGGAVGSSGLCRLFVHATADAELY